MLDRLQDMPSDAVTYALVVYSWLTWFTAQQRKLIQLGGPLTASAAAQVVANAGLWQDGGLVVMQWGAAHNGRVERQLRGRAGRQGDPGESHVIISLQDPTVFAEFAALQSVMQAYATSATSDMSSLCCCAGVHSVRTLGWCMSLSSMRRCLSFLQCAQLSGA
jgi:hypothetical protein